MYLNGITVFHLGKFSVEFLSGRNKRFIRRIFRIQILLSDFSVMIFKHLRSSLLKLIDFKEVM